MSKMLILSRGWEDKIICTELRYPHSSRRCLGFCSVNLDACPAVLVVRFPIQVIFYLEIAILKSLTSILKKLYFIIITLAAYDSSVFFYVEVKSAVDW